MPHAWIARARQQLVTWGVALALAGCQAPLGQVTPPQNQLHPAFGLDAVSLVEALAAKPGQNWQDAMLTYPPLVEARQRRASGRSLQAISAPGWSYNLGGDASSNVPVYAKESPHNAGPNPHPNDRLYVLTNNAKVLKFNPTSASAPAQAAPMVSPAGALPGSYAKTALAISGDNNRLYAFSTAGNFTILDANTLTQLYTKDISSSGFANCAFFIDYGLSPSGGNTNFGSIEHLYAVSSNGSVFRIVVDASSGGAPSVTVNAAAAPGETNPGSGAWSTSTALGIPASTVACFPVAWKGHVYYGTNTGLFFEVSFDTPSAPVLARSWDLSLNTTATGNGRAITAPAALDFDGAFDVDKVFVACGDRLNWIDVTDGSVTTSPSLTLDRSKALTSPAAAAPPNQGPLSGFTAAATTLTQYNPDWVSIKRSGLPPPTRWGGPLSALATIPALSVRVRPNGDVWVADYNNKVVIYHANGSPTKTINLSNRPTKLEFDGIGNCWVSVGGYASGGSQGAIEKIIVATETRVTTAPFPVTFRGAVYVAPDANGNCWVTDPFNRPGTGSPDATSGSGTAGRLQCIKASGAFAFANPIAVPVAGTIFCDPNDRPWVIPYGQNVIRRYAAAPAGTLQPPPAAPASITLGAAGSLPIGVAFRPSTTEAWVTLNNSAKSIAKVDTNSFTQIGALLPASGTGPTNPWTIRFAPDGEPWVGCGRLGQATPANVVKIDLNGNLAPGFNYPMSGGSPYELAFDAGGTVYVANANQTFSSGSLTIISDDLGNTGDIFATSYRGATGDGDDSYGFMRFKWAVNAFANQPLSDVRLSLTQNNAVSGDDLAFFLADNVRSSGGLWTGYQGGATPNTDWDTRPGVGVQFFTASNAAPGAGLTYNVVTPVPADKANVPGDTSNTHFTLAVQSTNRALKNAVHWFSDNTNTSTAQLPTLNVRRNSYAQLSTAVGIQCQPAVNAFTGHVYVAASNALFDLSYNTKGAFATANNVFYNFTGNGNASGYGPVNTGTSPKTFLNPIGNALFTYNRHVVIPDLTPGNTLNLNTFDTNTAPTANRLVGSTNITPGTGGVNTQMIFDYDNGSAYVITSNNYLIRAKVM